MTHNCQKSESWIQPQNHADPKLFRADFLCLLPRHLCLNPRILVTRVQRLFASKNLQLDVFGSWLCMHGSHVPSMHGHHPFYSWLCLQQEVIIALPSNIWYVSAQTWTTLSAMSQDISLHLHRKWGKGRVPRLHWSWLQHFRVLFVVNEFLLNVIAGFLSQQFDSISFQVGNKSCVRCCAGYFFLMLPTIWSQVLFGCLQFCFFWGFFFFFLQKWASNRQAHEHRYCCNQDLTNINGEHTARFTLVTIGPNYDDSLTYTRNNSFQCSFWTCRFGTRCMSWRT